VHFQLCIEVCLDEHTIDVRVTPDMTTEQFRDALVHLLVEHPTSEQSPIGVEGMLWLCFAE
jgi:hypothetical protein